MKEELAAIEQCWFLLETLSVEECERVIEWLRNKNNQLRMANYTSQVPQMLGYPLPPNDKVKK